MPAVTNNDTILKAINQMVQALLDLNIGGGGGGGDCPDVTVNVPAYEPVINVYNTIKCGGCGSGGSGSVGSGSPVDSDPTDGYIPGNDPVVDAAKCKRVNYVIDKYLDFLGLWGAVEGLLAIGPAEALATYLLGSSSLVFSSILVAGALVTLFWSVVTLFVGGLVMFSYIVAHAVDVRANRKELTCAMYNAATPGDMRQAIIDFMSNHLAGLPQSFVTYHVDAIFSNNVLNGVFNGWTDAGVIAELSAYTPPVGCDGCGSDEGCDALIGPHSASAKQIFTNPDRWGIAVRTEDGAEFPEMKNLGCHFGFKDNRVTVSGFNSYGTYFNVQYKVYGGQIYDLYVADINNYVFDQMYSEFSVYQSLTPFTLSFEVDRTQASS